jgi:1-acyl-sn-glycerol-3-phosphate acyltransferase
MFEHLIGTFLTVFARLVTGARSVWVDTAPTAVATLYFANHRSHGDFVLLWSCLPADLRTRTRPVAAADYWKRTAVRRFIAMRVFRAVLIDRNGAGDRADVDSDPIGQIAQVLEAGDSVIFFPEGTRNESDETLLPFKRGLHRLAQRCPDVRITPVWIDNLHRVLPKGEVIPVPLACTVAFGPSLPPETRGLVDGDSFLQAARTALLDLRPAHSREDT